MPDIDENKRETTKKDKFANLKFHLEEWIEADFSGELYDKNIGRWEQISEFYKGDLPAKNKEDSFPYKGAPVSNLLVSEFFIDGVAVRLKSFLMGEEFKADLRTSDASSHTNVEITEKFINAVFQHVLRIKKHIFKYCHLAAKKTVILRRDWVVEEKEKEVVIEPDLSAIAPEQVPIIAEQLMAEGFQGTEEELEREAVKRLTPEPRKETQRVRDEFAKISIVPNNDFAVPDDADSMESASRKTHRMYLTINDMKARNFDSIEIIETFVEKKKKETAKTDEEKAMIDAGVIAFGEERVEIYEITTPFKIDGVQDNWIVYYHQGSKTIAKTNKYREQYGDTKTQFTQLFFKDDATFWKRSVGDITFHTQKIGNDIINTALQMMAYILQGVTFYSDDAFDFDDENEPSLKTYPGAMNKVQDPNAIVFKTYPNQAIIAPEVIDSFFVNMLERVMGLSAPQFAQPVVQDKTLGEIQVIRAEGNLIHRAFFSGSAAEWEELIEGVLSLYQQHMAPDTFKELVDQEGKHIFPEGITREQIQGNFKAAVRGAKGLLSQQEEMQKVNTVVQMSDPALIQRMINTRKNLEKLLELNDLDPEEALRGEEEIQAELVKIQQQAILQSLPQILEAIAEKQAEMLETERTVKQQDGEPVEVTTKTTQKGEEGQSMSNELLSFIGSKVR